MSMMLAKQKTLPQVLISWLGGRSVRQAAASLGIADNTLHSWIRGSTLPPGTRIPSLARALGMTAEELSSIVAEERARRGAVITGLLESGAVVRGDEVQVPRQVACVEVEAVGEGDQHACDPIAGGAA